MSLMATSSRKEEVKVFQSNIDRRTITTAVFSQPSFYMGIGNILLMFLTQRFPEEFVPAKYLTMSYNGVRVPSMLSIPFCFICGGYLAVASAICTAPTPLSGHLFGYGLSVGLGLTMMTFRSISWYYPLLGGMYLTFGGFHHYRRMMVYGDNAPIFYWSDFSAIAQDMRDRRQQSGTTAVANRIA